MKITLFRHLISVSIFLVCGQAFAASEAKVSVTKRTTASSGKGHPCAADALSKALPLLTFHFGDDKFGDQPINNENIDQNVKVIGTVKPLVGKGKLDVLEVIGNIYKGSYRMHFIYAQIPGTCALMGQEIFELSNPY